VTAPTCTDCDAPLWPVAIHTTDRTIVRACPYCDRVDLMPRVNGTHLDRPYDYETDGGI
jgi:hypothetical protein